MISFSDTGVGMTLDVQSKIFEPFFTTKGLGKGTGLGLSTVYGIVKQNLGHVSVYSHPGMGTTFKIFFPRLPDSNASDPSPEPSREISEEAKYTETILVAEDESLVSGHIARVLRRWGYNVLVAGDGEQALALYRQEKDRIAMVLTDVVMPGMNGRQLIERLRSENPKLKSLFMSGYPEEVITEHGALTEGVEFLEKPFQTTRLLSRIREILDA